GSGRIVATTSDQILIDNIISSTTDPLISVASGTKIQLNSSNYWTVQGATTTDELGASPIAIAKIDGAWTSADTNIINIANWNPDNDNNIKIYTTDTARHKGKWNDDKYRLEINGGDVLTISENNIWIDGLQIKNTASAGSPVAIYTNGGISDLKISNNIIWMNVSADIGAGIKTNTPTSETSMKIWNNIIYSNLGGSNATYLGSGIFYLYNNTAYGLLRGFRSANTGETIYLKNNFSYNNDIIDYGILADSSSTNNLSSDDTAPACGTYYHNTNVSFVSTASGTEDFHLDVDKNSQIINAGADLSNDIGLSGIDKLDIDGGARNPDDLGWDIGADEVPAKQYRSVGNDSSDISSGGGTVTISSTTRTATFSEAQPTNIGVGDVIQYGSPYQLAFIISRASSTEYGVQNYDTKAPTATSSADFTIYRAHLELNDWESQLVAQVNTGISDTVDDLVLVEQDLVASNTTMMVSCYASDNGDDAVITFNGWDTGPQNYIKVYTPVDSTEVGATQRHDGKWNDDSYSIEFTTIASNQRIMKGGENYLRIDGLQIKYTSSYNDGAAVYIGAGDSSTDNLMYLSNNIIQGVLSNNSNATGLNLSDGDSSARSYVYNNIVYGFTGASCIRYRGSAYNNTAVNCVLGIATFNYEAINNIVQNSTTGFSGTNINSGYNISSDSTAPGNNSKINTAVNFIDQANNDFHLHPNDTTAIDAGTSTVSSLLTDDIDGDYRRTYDIGADEASVEFVSYITENAPSDGDFDNLSQWESTVQSDLTATTTAVFDVTSATGTFTLLASYVGQTSNATGTLVYISTTSNQILLSDITGDFTTGETISFTGSSAILSDSGNPAIAVAKIDGAWTSADNNAVTISGWETGEYNYVKIYTTDSARHNGKWDEGKYRLETTNNSGYGIRFYEDYTKLYGIQATAPSLGIYARVISGEGASNERVAYCIVKNTNNDSHNIGIYRVSYVYNNIVYDFNNNSSGIAEGEGYKYNNTVYNCARGIAYGGTVINNIVQDCTDGYYGSSNASSDYNISDISGDQPASGAHDKTGITVEFIDADNNDFHLDVTDTVAKDAGVDMNVLGFGFQVTSDDIDGHSRHDVGWDIGADEAPTIFYRSVGRHAYDLNTNSATATISVATNTATIVFSEDLPTNIGVGDAIEYGSPLQLAFITSRVSASTYYIQSATGSPPVATSSATASVYRAHEYLDDWEDQIAGDVNQVIDAGLQSDVLVTQDLVASNTAMFVPCYASSSADDLSVDIDGWTTGTSSYIKIYTPISDSEVGTTQRHGGIWNDIKYRIQTDPGNGNSALLLSNNFIKIIGIQLKVDGNGTSRAGINMTGSGIYDIRNNIIVGNITGSTYARGIKADSSMTAKYNLVNNVVYNWHNNQLSSAGIAIYAPAGKTVNVYNNTIYNCYIGIDRDGLGTSTIKNNVVFNNINDFANGFTIIEYNASDDGDGTNAISLGSSTVTWKAAFTDYENYDFSVRDLSSVLYDAGTTITIVTDDIIGTARPYHDIYDVGAFEFVNSKKGFRFKPGGNFKFKGHFEFK
ncbi:hypothetical protein KAI92_04190, partial [Candidatus Parcubacteria bacterium]|nr:hypothetical protein [Candidatus Parcubacteria bacterium]